MEKIFFVTLVIECIALLFEAIRNYMCKVKITGRNKFITNNDRPAELFLLIIATIAFHRSLLDYDVIDMISLRDRYIICTAINVIGFIYALSQHNHFKKQYVLDGIHIYKANDLNNKLPYSFIELMYIERKLEEKPMLLVGMYINKKKYSLKIETKDYYQIRENLNTTVKENSKKIDNIESPINEWAKKGAVIITTIITMILIFSIFIGEILGYPNLTGYMVIVLILLALIAAVIIRYGALNNRRKAIKKVLNGETII